MMNKQEIDDECTEILLKMGYSPLYTACRSQKEYFIYRAGRLKSVEEIEKYYNQKLNIIEDCRNFCYRLGIQSTTRIGLERMLEVR